MLADSSQFGCSIASLGDLDGDGVGDIAVGDNRENGGRGSVYILFLNSNGTVKGSQKITVSTGIDFMPDGFGTALATLGDIDGDDLTDLAVGAAGESSDVVASGAVYVLFLNANGTVKSRQRISSEIGGGPTLDEGDQLGKSLSSLGDIDGDGVTDLAVGSDTPDNRGAVHMLLLNRDGTVKSKREIASELGGGPALINNAYFGRAVASLGDLDGDGQTDLAVGSAVSTFGTDPGSVYVLFLKSRKNVQAMTTKKIASGTGGGPPLVNGDMFGASVAALGDLDGDGVEDMAVGTPSQTGAASSGAVHVLFMNSNGTVKTSQQIGSSIGGGPALAHGDYFGHSVAAIGDLNGDGITDLVVGASKDDTGGYISGAVYILFLNVSGTVKSSQKIASGIGGAPGLVTGDRFGSAVASLGDLDGDGVDDLAVGATGDDTGGSYRGAVHVLFMNANGTVKASQKIASGVGGGPTLANVDVFGVGLASLGDLDGDQVSDLAVAAMFDDTGGTGRGAVHVLFLNRNGTVKTSQKIASSVGGGPPLGDGDYFGRSVASLGDLDGDGLSDLAVGAYRDDTGGADRGALHALLLNANGTVKRNSKIASSTGGGPALANDDHFGSGVAPLGDLDGDGMIDLAVGAEMDDTGGNGRGAVQVLFLSGANASPVFTSPTLASVRENTTHVMVVTAVDEDEPARNPTFTIVGGEDRVWFNITSGGRLSFNAPPNYEAPADANRDNFYVVIVEASDRIGGIATQTIYVDVTPVQEQPVFTSPTSVDVAENTLVVITLTAVDPDVPPLPIKFSLSGSRDASKFSLTPGGVLSFKTKPDFEAPMDDDGDNVYVVPLEADEGFGGSSRHQTITVTVTNVAVEPLIGDYNNNGSVDMADYVLWRNGGPLQNEEATPGVVTQEDYGVWRANFERTLPGFGEARGQAEVASSTSYGSGVEDSSEPLAMESPLLSDDRTLAVPTNLHTASARTAAHRPAQRGRFTNDSVRDDALTAWLASRYIEQSRRPFRGASADLLDFSPKDRPMQPIDALELAFAVLD
jgi:hypothetical protein